MGKFAKIFISLLLEAINEFILNLHSHVTNNENETDAK